jgi:hypothetical protein
MENAPLSMIAVLSGTRSWIERRKHDSRSRAKNGSS